MGGARPQLANSSMKSRPAPSDWRTFKHQFPREDLRVATPAPGPLLMPAV